VPIDFADPANRRTYSGRDADAGAELIGGGTLPPGARRLD
jgi:hypothetical protein